MGSATYAEMREAIDSETVDATLQRLREIEARRRVDAAEEALSLAKLDSVKAYATDGHASMRGGVAVGVGVVRG